MVAREGDVTTSRGSLLGEATLPGADRAFRADLLHWTARRLPGCTSGAIREAAIVIGELLTNAYSHGEPPFRVSISARQRGHLLRIAVDDGATAPHAPWSPGKGLLVVRGLCRRWGVRSNPTGKTVWADLPLLVPALPAHEDGGHDAGHDDVHDDFDDDFYDDADGDRRDGDPTGVGDERGFDVPHGQPERGAEAAVAEASAGQQ
jgi:hypothetical protein